MDERSLASGRHSGAAARAPQLMADHFSKSMRDPQLTPAVRCSFGVVRAPRLVADLLQGSLRAALRLVAVCSADHYIVGSLLKKLVPKMLPIGHMFILCARDVLLQLHLAVITKLQATQCQDSRSRLISWLCQCLNKNNCVYTKLLSVITGY